ncbi:MAG TPA: DUF3124 domain-containing protein, partial [Phormidium sp.]
MKRFITFFALILVLLISSCNSLNISSKSQINSINPPLSQLQRVTLDENIKIAAGETLYVPVYSHIYYEDQEKVLNLAATLSIR